MRIYLLQSVTYSNAPIGITIKGWKNVMDVKIKDKDKMHYVIDAFKKSNPGIEHRVMYGNKDERTAEYELFDRVDINKFYPPAVKFGTVNLQHQRSIKRNLGVDLIPRELSQEKSNAAVKLRKQALRRDLRNTDFSNKDQFNTENPMALKVEYKN